LETLSSTRSGRTAAARWRNDAVLRLNRSASPAVCFLRRNPTPAGY
jgi:hypothetical protein